MGCRREVGAESDEGGTNQVEEKREMGGRSEVGGKSRHTILSIVKCLNEVFWIIDLRWAVEEKRA